MKLRITFLGTSGSIPTPERNLPAVSIQRETELFMFDCGEGVQRQMVKSRVPFHKEMKILITHMHGDHILGLPGLLQTMALQDRKRKLEIYGPHGIRRFVEVIGKTIHFIPTFPIEIHEIIEEGIVCKEKQYVIMAVHSNHVISSFAYAFIEVPRPGKFYPEKARAMSIPEGPLWSKLQAGIKVELSDGTVIKPEEVTGKPRPGRKIVYTGDTRPFGALVRVAYNADVLIHDSTFSKELADKAEEDGHSTSSQAAESAKKANVKQLVLIHISARYPDVQPLLAQAKKIFENTVVAEDLLTIELRYINS